MYISKVKIENIRGVGADGFTVDLAGPSVRARGTMAGWNVIAGPNGCGKTTILQGIAACLVGPTGATWLIRPDEVQTWLRTGAASGGATVWVERVPDDDGAHASSDATLRPVPLTVAWSGNGARTYPPRGNHGFLITQFWDAASLGVKPDGWVFVGYGARRGASRSSNDAASLLRGPARNASVVTLFRDDAALERGYEWLSGLALAKARGDSEKASLLDGVLRILGDHLLEPERRSVFSVEEDGLRVAIDNKAPMSPRSLGDGFRMLIELVVDLLLQIERFKPGRLLEDTQRWPASDDAHPYVTMSGVVVIDEPEHHLHPALQQHIGFWLKRHFPNIQFLVTTHSALVCQAADQGGLMRMSQPFQVEAVDEDTWEKVTNGTVDDAITTRLFGLTTPYAPEGLKLRKELAEIELKM